MREICSAVRAGPVPLRSNFRQHGGGRKLLGAKTMQGAAAAFVARGTAKSVDIEGNVLSETGCQEKKKTL